MLCVIVVIVWVCVRLATQMWLRVLFVIHGVTLCVVFCVPTFCLGGGGECVLLIQCFVSFVCGVWCDVVCCVVLWLCFSRLCVIVMYLYVFVVCDCLSGVVRLLFVCSLCL